METPQRKHIEPQTVACLDHQGPYGDIGSVHHRLFAWAGQAGVEPAGRPFTRFLSPPDEAAWKAGRFEVCLPVPQGTEGSGDVEVRRLPATDVLYTVVEGPYSELPAHYAEFLAWLSWEGVEPSGPPREVYLVHPDAGGGGDPQTFRTELQFPVGPQA
ncbi:MAG: GyrI-like domain-containing protein [Candidatus Brocadiia bacterium]